MPNNSVEWEKFLRHATATWKQGEHVAIVGPTGCGKTTLESRLLPVRQYVVIFVTKIHDKTITNDFPGYERIEKWPPKLHQDKVLLWPKPGKTIRETYAIQQAVFKEALDRIFTERNWCVVFDEQHYISQQLKLGIENAMILQQGRSSGLSVVNGTQRPAWVPVVTYSSATHAFIYKTTYRDDLRRLADIGGVDTRALQSEILQLGKHDFVYVNSRVGDVMRSQVRL